MSSKKNRTPKKNGRRSTNRSNNLFFFTQNTYLIKVVLSLQIC